MTPEELGPKQLQIYEGLNHIGPEIATYYLDACEIINGNIKYKASLLGHAAREIDGGLRDIFSADHVKERIQRKLYGDNEEKELLPYLADKLGPERDSAKGKKLYEIVETRLREKREGGLHSSILAALNVKKDSALAKKWKKVAKEFHHFAHRRGAYKEIRDFSRFKPLWDDYEDILLHVIGSYYSLTRLVTNIIENYKDKAPTEEVLEALPNLLREEARASEFYRNLRSELWLEPLINRGFFSADQAVGPKQVGDGYQFPPWHPLEYLLTLSERIKSNEIPADRYTPQIIRIIRDISERHKAEGDLDSSRLWSSILKIIMNLPVALIPIELLHYIPHWTKSRFRMSASFFTHEIVEKLLPKFLDEASSDGDILKAGYIFEQSIAVVYEPIEEDKMFFGHPYNGAKPIVDSYWLENELLNRGLIKTVAAMCSAESIRTIAKHLAGVIRYESIGSVSQPGENAASSSLRIKNREGGKIYYQFGTQKMDNVLERFSPGFDEDASFDIDDKKDKGAFAAALRAEFEKSKVPITEIVEDVIEKAFNAAYSDSSFVWIKSIPDGTDFYSKDTDTLYVSLLFQALSERIKAHEDAEVLLKEMLDDKYEFPIFKRIALSAINDNWEKLKHLFWSFVAREGINSLLSDCNLERELKSIFENHAVAFEKDQLQLLNDAIAEGPQIQVEENKVNWWKIKWYKALSNVGEFNALFDEYKTKVDYVEEKEAGESGFLDAETAPHPDFAEISVHEIISIIQEEKQDSPLRAIDTHSIGISLQNDVIFNPLKYEEALLDMLSLPYEHVSYLLRGFKSVWENGNDVDWKKILDYLFAYISQDQFATEGLRRGDKRWTAGPEWVYLASVSLISTGVNNDAHAADFELMPQLKSVLTLILGKIDFKAEDDSDYSFRYTALECLIDVSLRILRVEKKTNPGTSWNPELMSLYTDYLNDKVPMAFYVLGSRISNVRALNKEWLHKQLQNLVGIGGECLERFMIGYTHSANPTKEEFEILRPVYKHVMEYESLRDGSQQYSIAKHLICIYLNDYEGLVEDSLIADFIEKSSPERFERLIRSLWHDKITMRAYGYAAKVLQLFSFAVERLKNSEVEGVKEKLGLLSLLIAYMDEITPESAELLEIVAQYIGQSINSSWLIEDLKRILLLNKNTETALNAARIFQSMLAEGTPTFPEAKIIELVELLYEFKDAEVSQIADHICNKYGENGSYILRATYINQHPDQ